MTHLQYEGVREAEFQKYVDLARQYAPAGKWLDIGCGTGTLIRLAKKADVEADGIELTPDRRKIAQRQTGSRIYGEPLEALGFPASSFAAITMINVFSHLISPTETLRHINEVLQPGGILLLATGEIGPGVKKHHMYNWELGNHLYWLGNNTIHQYAEKLGFVLLVREKFWQPAQTYRRERFKMKGRSKIRDAIKLACLTPGVFPLVRYYALRRNAGNPVYASTLILKKI